MKRLIIISIVIAASISILIALAVNDRPVGAQSSPIVEGAIQPGNQLTMRNYTCAAEGQGSVPRAAPSLACTMTITNNSAKSLRAICVEWDSYDASDKEIFHSTAVDDFGFPLPGIKMIPPGKSTEEEGDGSPRAAKIVGRVKFEEFGDGSTWGDSHSPEFMKLIAKRNGARLVIDYLRSAKRQVGADKSLENLGIH